MVTLAIVVGIIQNSHSVSLDYLGWHWNVSLIAVLLGAIVLTVAMTSLVGVLWRKSRRERLGDTQELYALREKTSLSEPIHEATPPGQERVPSEQTKTK